MARGKPKFNSTFAVLEQCPGENGKWKLLSAGHEDASAAEASLKKELESRITEVNSKFLIVNVKKGFAPKVTLSLNEEGGADALNVKPSTEDPDEVVSAPVSDTFGDGIRTMLVNTSTAEAGPAKPTCVDLPDTLKYEEPTGSDPIPVSNVPKTNTSETSGESAAPLPDHVVPARKSPVPISTDRVFPPRW